VLAHWQFGLGRAVAFTSDAKAKWARPWLGWAQYRQFWAQAAHWSLRRLEPADLNADVNIEQGQGQLTVEAMDPEGNYRNFLHLQATVVGPRGDSSLVRLEQTGPGHYEAKFPTKEVGSYLLHLMDMKDGKIRGSQVLGASVNYSPEFIASEPNANLLRRMAETGGGKVLDPGVPALNPFLHDRQKTFQPRDLWETLLKWAVLLFVLDVGVRRIQLDRDEVRRAVLAVRRKIFFWETVPRAPEAEESLAALLARREQVRSTTTAPSVQPAPELFQPERPPTEPLPGYPRTETPAPPSEPAVESEQPQEAGPTTTSRLLEAKRRAQRRQR
jgi:hypothetical protein